MFIFQWTLVLLLAAVLLTGVARRIGAPYPALLALAGAGLALLPLGPAIVLEPDLALALFVAPVLLDAAFDTSPRDLWRNRAALASLVVVLVVATTAVVAWLGMSFAGLPLWAAVALGAIVAPPDASAASAVLGGLSLPRRVSLLLQGESLLNDAIALLIYRFAVAAAAGLMASRTAPGIALALVASPLAGFVFARLYLLAMRRVHDAASMTVLSFVATFGLWLLAERLSLSPIIAVVAYAMTLGQSMGGRSSARLRVSAYSVWETVVFVLNVLAFVIMGLQVGPILDRLSGPGRAQALGFGGLVLAAVILVRLVYVMGYGAIVRLKNRCFGANLPEGVNPPTVAGGAIVAWSGMRGLVTLATAFALPTGFPGRDLIVLAAFMVVLGTLVIQGVTLRPLLRWLKIADDGSVDREVSRGRVAVMQAALDALAQEDASPAAAAAREGYLEARHAAEDEADPQAATELDRLKLKAIAAQRLALGRLRREGRIGDDAYHRLEEELDWAELDAAPAGSFQPLTTEGPAAAARRLGRFAGAGGSG